MKSSRWRCICGSADLDVSHRSLKVRTKNKKIIGIGAITKYIIKLLLRHAPVSLDTTDYLNPFSKQ